MKRNNRITVLMLGDKKEIFTLLNVPDSDEKHFDVVYEYNHADLPFYDVILTVGESWKNFPEIANLSYEFRKKWVHTEKITSLTGMEVLTCYLTNVTENKNKQPLVSVFSSTYKTGIERLTRSYECLKNQTYTNWEWVCFDDSPDNETFEQLTKMAEQDRRISVYKSSYNTGNIGEQKYRCCALAKGDIFLEFDHDDELTVDALQLIVSAFEKYPDAGFAYTDWVEIFEDGEPIIYGPGFGMGYGSYRQEQHPKWGTLNVCQALNINPKTIRHIVGVPNHIRAWTRKGYETVGGYSRNCFIADDYEILIRTFLKTKMVKIPKLCYFQYYSKEGISNTQNYRRKEIQRHVRYLAKVYDEQIHDRFVELGIDDYVYHNNNGHTNIHVKNAEVEQFANYVY